MRKVRGARVSASLVREFSIKTYVRKNLAELSSEMLCQYLHNTLLPVMIKEEMGIEKGSDGYMEALRNTVQTWTY